MNPQTSEFEPPNKQTSALKHATLNPQAKMNPHKISEFEPSNKLTSLPKQAKSTLKQAKKSPQTGKYEPSNKQKLTHQRSYFEALK